MIVLYQENKGYGRAVNRGIETAVGEYIGIVEPDDHIGLDMMRALYKVVVQNDVDYVKADYEVLWGDGHKRYLRRQKVVLDDALYGRKLNPSIETDVFWGWIANWSGIYKRSFLLKNQIYHNETPGAAYQDQGFWFQVNMLAEKVFFVSEAYYKYQQDNPHSSMLSQNKIFCIADEYDFIYRIMNKRFKRLNDRPLLMAAYIKKV